jgi:hypothetical protein
LFHPTKAKIQGTIEYLEAQKIPHSKPDVFSHFGVRKRSGWAILANEHPRRRHNDLLRKETRGKPSKIPNQDIAKMDRILQSYGMDGRVLTWAQLGYEAGLEVSGRTVQRHMGTMDYRKCLACKKGWILKATAKNRVSFASTMLVRYPERESWYNVRFSDEMHSGFGPQHTLHIIRRPGERHCPDCIQHASEPDDKDQKRQHNWAAAGHNFKSQIVFYEVLTNSNGKMS